MRAAILERHRVRVSGSGRQTLVLAHGFGTTLQSWRAQVAAFSDTYRIVRFDLAGAVSTDAPSFDLQRHATLDGYVDDLLDILAALELHDTIYVGHSMSGMIGLLAARAQPSRFQHLICISTSPHYLTDGAYVGGFTQADVESIYSAMAQDYSRWALAFAPQMMGSAERSPLVREFYRSLRALSPEIARSVMRAILQSDYRAILPEVSTPTLVVQSADDPAVARSVGHFMARALPRATLREIAAYGHFPQLTAPDVVNAAIQAYLDEQHMAV